MRHIKKFALVGGFGLFVLVIAVLCQTTLTHAQQRPAQPQPAKPPESPLPIRHVVLFNSGVGYIQREGEVVGNSRVELTFPTSDVNDLLRDQFAKSPDDRLDDGLARVGLDVGEGGAGELIEPSRVGMPRPARPEGLGEDAEIGGQVREDVSPLALGQKGSEGREDRSGARALGPFGCTAAVGGGEDTGQCR